MLTDTIPTPGWWLCGLTDRRALPYGEYEIISVLLSDGSNRACIRDMPVQAFTHDPAAVLAWVRDGVLP